MCTPSNGTLQAISSIIGVTNDYWEHRQNKENYEYRTQVALNNAKKAENEARRQEQLGIEKSRQEKIEGIQKANQLKAINSASNLDVNSQTNMLAYEDIMEYSDFNADNILNQYEQSANNYFNQANSYLEEVQQYKKQYNQSLFDFALNALGKTQNVADSWYKSKRG